MIAHNVGDRVTILPPYDGDPVLIAMQHYGTVAEVEAGERGNRYKVTLPATYPPGQAFGPFPAHRVAPGWRDATGRWRTL